MNQNPELPNIDIEYISWANIQKNGIYLQNYEALDALEKINAKLKKATAILDFILKFANKQYLFDRIYNNKGIVNYIPYDLDFLNTIINYIITITTLTIELEEINIYLYSPCQEQVNLLIEIPVLDICILLTIKKNKDFKTILKAERVVFPATLNNSKIHLTECYQLMLAGYALDRMCKEKKLF